MILSEEQARANIKELIAYDALKEISSEQDKRIDNLKAQVEEFTALVKTKDDIIARKDSIILYKDEIIKLKDRVIISPKIAEFHSYAGVDFIDLRFRHPTFYWRSSIELNKLNINGQVNGRPTEYFLPGLPQFYFTLGVEFKIH